MKGGESGEKKRRRKNKDHRAINALPRPRLRSSLSLFRLTLHSTPTQKNTQKTPGDGAPVIIGEGTNIQDGATVRTTPEDIDAASSSGGGALAPTTLGARVTVGHNASIGAGVVVGDEALIGMGASLGDGAVIEARSMVAAGAAVAAGAVVPQGELWGGVPARRLRALKPEEATFLPVSATKYAELAAGYAKEGLGA